MSAPTPRTATFLFTDIEGSTRRWEADRAAMAAALARHDAIVRAAIESQGGTVFKTVGDAFCAVFSAATASVEAALAAQRSLAVEDWSAFGAAFAQLRVRMALHVGEAQQREGDYFGPTLNRVARLLAAGHGGQVLLTDAARGLLQDGLPQGVALRDLGERRLKDLRAPERVWQLLAPDLPADFPPLATLDARPNNLPAQANSLVGRVRELGELTQELRSAQGPRLLTLTGPGGTGKTRLALQAAADVVDAFADGVWLVELASLAEGDLVASATAGALGVAVEGGRTAAEAVVLWARERHLLLLLDNCEQVIEGAARLADALLRAAPGLRILATSREPLAVPGEMLRPVAPLVAPAAMDLAAATPESLAAFDAVRLFTERAAAVRPGFVVTAANAPAVAQLCHRLDGIPLALELAAARVGALAVEDIVARLDQRFRLLGGGSRTVLPRHQTLRACLDWSHDLLSEAERTLFRRLGAFAGRFSLAAAEAVGAGGDIEALDVLDLLTSLCARSLVVAEFDGGESRYRLLDTMRSYAREQLEASGEGPATRDRHLAWCLAMAQEAEPRYASSEGSIWLRRMASHNDDLLAALQWGLPEDHSQIDAQRARSAIELALALVFYLFQTDFGLGSERLYVRAVGPARSLADPRLLAQVLYRGGMLDELARLVDPSGQPSPQAGPAPEGADDRVTQTTIQLGRAILNGDERLPQLLLDLDLPREAGWLVQDLATGLFHDGDLDGAERLFLKSLAIKSAARPLWRWDQAIIFSNLCDLHRSRHDFKAALEAIERALDIYALDPGLAYQRGWCHSNHAMTLVGLGRVEEAVRALRTCVSEAQARGHVQFCVSFLPAFATVACRMHDGYRSARLFGATVALWAEAGDDFHGMRRASLSPCDWEDFHAAEAAARQLLSAAVWEQAFAQGAALSAEAAVAYAMEESDPWTGAEEGRK